MSGVNVSGQLTRQNLLAFHKDTITRMLMESDWDDPVGFIIDATDRMEGELARVLIANSERINLEQAEAKLSRLRDEYRSRRETLTLLFIDDWEFTERVMPYLSPMASETLKRMRAKRGSGMELIVVVASAGNSYRLVGMNRPVGDGQHRISSVPWR